MISEISPRWFLDDPDFFQAFQKKLEESNPAACQESKEASLIPHLFHYFPGTLAFESQQTLIDAVLKATIFLRQLNFDETEKINFSHFIHELQGNRFIVENIFQKIFSFFPTPSPIRVSSLNFSEDYQLICGGSCLI